MERDRVCKHCGGSKYDRNPTGSCDHLYWPDNLTDEAKRANGYVLQTVPQWVREQEDREIAELEEALWDSQTGAPF